MSWSPDQYVVFEDERTRPVRDLLSAVPTKQARFVADIGCGPGNSTEVLATNYPGAEALGLDSSAEMIAAARKRLPASHFEQADIESWETDKRFDVILANAVLQWVPDHARLLPSLMNKLTPGGSLSIQMPDNSDEPVQSFMRDVAAEGPWSSRLADASGMRVTMGDVDWHYQLLRPLCVRLDIWRTTYFHQLKGGHDAVVEWFKGSGLRPFLAPLNESERSDFLARYRAKLVDAMPLQADGTVLLPFPRLFIVATR